MVGPLRITAGDSIQFDDDAFFDEDRAIALLGAATIVKVGAIYEAIAQGDMRGAGAAASEAAVWLREFGLANVTAEVLLSEMDSEVPTYLRKKAGG